MWDRADHEGRIMPYLLAGLFDPLDSMQKFVFEQLEEIGRIYEVEHVRDRGAPLECE